MIKLRYLLLAPIIIPFMILHIVSVTVENMYEYLKDEYLW